MSEAAKIIQSRFRSYNHYRQFQRSRRAAIVIQSHYRGYRAQEQFRKSRDAAILIQQRFRYDWMCDLVCTEMATSAVKRSQDLTCAWVKGHVLSCPKLLC